MKNILIAVALVASTVTPVAAQDQIGRFAIVTHPINSVAVFLLDTVTGETWQLTRFSGLNGEPFAWNILAKLDTDADRATFANNYGNKPVPEGPPIKLPPTAPNP